MYWTLILATPAFGASWFVDSDNVSGITNGTSWATAWDECRDVVWTSIAAGDTIWVSDGVYLVDGFFIGKSGTPADPITIKKSQAVGHSGIAWLTNGILAELQGHTNIIFDGAISASFIAPTNYQQVEFGPTAVTNNCGFRVDNAIYGIRNTSPINGLEVRWVNFTRVTNTATIGNAHVFWFPIGTGGAQRRNIIEYCHIGLSGADAVQWTGGSATEQFDDKIIRFVHFRDFGDDGIEGSGFTLHDFIFGPSKQLSGHADQLQTQGSYIKAYNGLMRQGGLNSFMRIQAGYGAGEFQERFGNMRFYNLIFDCERYTDQGYPTPANPIEFVNYNPQNGNTNVIWDDVVFANNTAYGYTNDASLFFSWNMSFGASGGNSTNAFITNSIWANNLIVDCNKGVGASWVSDLNFPPYGIHHRAQDLIWDWNTVTGTNAAAHMQNAKRQIYRGISYVTGADFAAGEEWNQNTTNYPAFVDSANSNYELAVSDTAALNTGTNLSAFFTTDALNRPRNTGGAWDRGALEAQGLVVFLSFDSDTAGGNALDSSGNGFDGKRFNLSEYSYPSNRLASAVAGTTFRPNITGNAADFLWRTNNGVYNPTYLDDGAFFAVTNAHSRLTNMAATTVMCWARYNTVDRTDVADPDYSYDANIQLLSGGTATGTPGSWFLGRYNLSIFLNNTRFVVTTNPSFTGSFGTVGDRVIGRSGQVLFEFPDRGFDNNGDTTNWYHYAVTFSNGLVKIYFNGLAWATNDVSANLTKLSLGRGAGRPYDWLGVGVNTHVGTPQFDNETGTDYPNNGWLNGGLDQVRIYDRALSWQEVVNVANSEGAQFADAPPDDGGGGDPGPDLTFARGTPKIRGLRLHP